ncbi:MAG: hypothetical protein ACRDL8_17715, partial [Solirubrobacteraceae bacterium]
MRRALSPTVVACAAALVGVMGILSTMTPEVAARSRLVQGILPQGLPSLARTLTISLSLALLWLARGLALRKRRAWQLAVVLVIASTFTHLAKGLDVEEATGALVVLCLLLLARREFVAPGDPESIRPLLQVVLGICVIVPIALLHAAGTVASSDRVDDAFAYLTGALAVRALFIW